MSLAVRAGTVGDAVDPDKSLLMLLSCGELYRYESVRVLAEKGIIDVNPTGNIDFMHRSVKPVADG